jgi:hypothetical protein
MASVTNYVRHPHVTVGNHVTFLSFMSHVTVGTHVTLGTHVIKREPLKAWNQVQTLILSRHPPYLIKAPAA